MAQTLDDRVRLSSKAGLHGRPGALLVDLAGKNPKTKIYLIKKGKKVEADSILNLLALGVGKGEEVGVSVVGGHEEAILSQVKLILEGKKT